MAPGTGRPLERNGSCADEIQIRRHALGSPIEMPSGHLEKPGCGTRERSRPHHDSGLRLPCATLAQ